LLFPVSGKDSDFLLHPVGDEDGGLVGAGAGAVAAGGPDEALASGVHDPDFQVARADGVLRLGRKMLAIWIVVRNAAKKRDWKSEAVTSCSCWRLRRLASIRY
jgi:hypothetical protein